jgi:hypothetical protein
MRSSARLLAGGLALAVAACIAPEDGGSEQGDAALRLFDLARIDEPTDEQLQAVIAEVPAADRRAQLLDALAALADASDPRVVEIVQPAGPGDAFVDLTARLADGGEARFGVRVATVEPNAWRVRWFQGPDVDWPPSRRPQGDALSTSAPPPSTD